jgi:hypothetical protein
MFDWLDSSNCRLRYCSLPTLLKLFIFANKKYQIGAFALRTVVGGLRNTFITFVFLNTKNTFNICNKSLFESYHSLPLQLFLSKIPFQLVSKLWVIMVQSSAFMNLYSSMFYQLI